VGKVLLKLVPSLLLQKVLGTKHIVVDENIMTLHAMRVVVAVLELLREVVMRGQLHRARQSVLV